MWKTERSSGWFDFEEVHCGLAAALVVVVGAVVRRENNRSSLVAKSIMNDLASFRSLVIFFLFV